MTAWGLGFSGLGFRVVAGLGSRLGCVQVAWRVRELSKRVFSRLRSTLKGIFIRGCGT